MRRNDMTHQEAINAINAAPPRDVPDSLRHPWVRTTECTVGDLATAVLVRLGEKARGGAHPLLAHVSIAKPTSAALKNTSARHVLPDAIAVVQGALSPLWVVEWCVESVADSNYDMLVVMLSPTEPPDARD
jgi:hypothetical protein